MSRSRFDLLAYMSTDEYRASQRELIYATIEESVHASFAAYDARKVAESLKQKEDAERLKAIQDAVANAMAAFRADVADRPRASSATPPTSNPSAAIDSFHEPAAATSTVTAMLEIVKAILERRQAGVEVTADHGRTTSEPIHDLRV
jgi:hypothetical protein